MKKQWFFLWMMVVCCNGLFAQNSYFITAADGSRLFVNEYGAGKPVILLAGGPGLNAGYLEPVCKKLEGYRCIVPDQRGTGKSNGIAIDSIHFTVDSYVEDLEALRVHLKLKKLVLVGHSWGGMLSFAYAAKYPNNVDRLVLLGSGGITGTFFNYFSSNIQMRLYKEDLEEKKTATGMGAHLKAIWPGYFYSRERALASKQLLDASFANADASNINSFTLKDYKLTEVMRANGLQKYKSPVFVIQGRQDPVGESTVYETKGILPQTHIAFIEKCGHLPWLEGQAAANEFYELMRAALK